MSDPGCGTARRCLQRTRGAEGIKRGAVSGTAASDRDRGSALGSVDDVAPLENHQRAWREVMPVLAVGQFP